MPILLPDGYSEALFEHLYDPEQNRVEYMRINELAGESLLPHVAFNLASDQHELKLLRSPECQYELQVALLDHVTETVLYSNTIETVDLDA